MEITIIVKTEAGAETQTTFKTIEEAKAHLDTFAPKPEETPAA